MRVLHHPGRRGMSVAKRLEGLEAAVCDLQCAVLAPSGMLTPPEVAAPAALRDALAKGDYPRCPWCGSLVVAAMMTGRSVHMLVQTDRPGLARYYHPDDLSLHCSSGSCTWDQPLVRLTGSVPEQEVPIEPARP